MKLIKPSVEIWDQEPTLDGAFKQIERAGRICYASESKGDPKAFVDMLIKRGHTAMLEHGTIYLFVPIQGKAYERIPDYSFNPYSVIEYISGAGWAITTNYRVLVENKWLNDLKYLCTDLFEVHPRRVTAHFTMDRVGSQSFERHRKFSFAQESTRYCNYSNDRFEDGLTFIIPSWFEINMLGNPVADNNEELSEFKSALESVDAAYFTLLHKGWTPQQARQILPGALKTELIMTGFVEDWKHFFDLRVKGTTGAPHPDAKAIAEPLMKMFEERGLI